jgi:hypothetical protein
MKTSLKIFFAFVFVVFLCVLSFGPRTIHLTLHIPEVPLFSWMWSKSDEIQVPSAEAAEQYIFSNWDSWPKSQKYKAPDGEWIMPFEIYKQEYIRNDTEGEYRNQPVHVDINSDGLMDILYSYLTEPEARFSPYQQWYDLNGRELMQYLLLGRPNGTYSIAFKCYQRPDYTRMVWWWQYGTLPYHVYYGDCADTSSSFDPDSYPSLFNTGDYLRQWNISTSKIINVPRDVSTAIGEITYHNKCWEGGTNATKGACDYKIPKLMDINGDTLLDVVFSGTSRKLSYDPHKLPLEQFSLSAEAVSFIYLNTGRGFVPQQ